MSSAPSPAEAAILDPDTERAERHGRMLKELAEIGMELARDLRDQVKAGTTPLADPGLTFSRISRAVRLTMALELKLAEERKARDRDDPAKREARLQAEKAAELAATPIAERRRKVLKAVVPDMIEAEVGQFPTEAEEELYSEADSLVDEELDDETVLNRPMPELISVICKALEVEPDWTLWDPAEWAETGCLTEAELAAGRPVKRPRRLQFADGSADDAAESPAVGPP